MTPEREIEILRWLSQKKHRHVERYASGECNSTSINVIPEEMEELRKGGLAMTASIGSSQWYITALGRARIT